MFWKRLERRQSGKKHTYWTWVESIRTARGSRHRVVGTPKAMRRGFEQHLVDKDWHEVQAGVEVKRVPGPDGEETFLPARSADRRKKEKAMHDRFLERMEAGTLPCT